jgi:uncharacterized protein with HEPN domain
MLDAANMMIEFTEGQSRDEFGANEVLSLATLRLLEVLGEASKGISAEFKEMHPELRWRAIAGTRDRLAHGYFDVDLDVVWTIVANDIPRLAGDLEKLVEPGIE